MTLSNDEKKKIREEALVKYNSNPALQNRYASFNSYISSVVDNLLVYQASEKLQAEYQGFANYQSYKEGVDLGSIKERKKVA